MAVIASLKPAILHDYLTLRAGSAQTLLARTDYCSIRELSDELGINTSNLTCWDIALLLLQASDQENTPSED